MRRRPSAGRQSPLACEDELEGLGDGQWSPAKWGLGWRDACLVVLAGLACLEVLQEIAQALLYYGTAKPRQRLEQRQKKFLYLLREDLEPPHFFPMKGANERKSGFLEHTGPTDIAQPSWVFVHDKPLPNTVVHHTPVIDSEGHIYIADSLNKLYALAPDGSHLWSFQVGNASGARMPGPVLLGRNMYLVEDAVHILKISLATGKLQWRKRYSWPDRNDGDLKELIVTNGMLILTGSCSASLAAWCHFAITALEPVDGRVMWQITDRAKGAKDVLPVLADGLLLLLLEGGQVHSWDVATGERRWNATLVEAHPLVTVTSGAMAAGQEGALYATCFETQQGSEIDHATAVALDLRTGRELWRKRFPNATTSGLPVVFTANGMTLLSLQLVEPHWRRSRGPRVQAEAELRVLETRTSQEVWGMKNTLEDLSDLGTDHCRGGGWSDPAVGSDGTLYIGRADGLLYALEGTSGGVRSFYDMGSNVMAAPAIAPGVLVVASCQWTAVFQANRQAPVAEEARQRPQWPSTIGQSSGRLWAKWHRTAHGLRPSPSVKVLVGEVYEGRARAGILVEGAGSAVVNGFFELEIERRNAGQPSFNRKEGKDMGRVWHSSEGKWFIGLVPNNTHIPVAYYHSSEHLPLG